MRRDKRDPIIGVIIILISVLLIIFPESALRFRDMFRIKGEREYTDFAIMMNRLGGILGVIMGLLLIF